MRLMIPFVATSLLSAVTSASILEILDLLSVRQTKGTDEEAYFAEVCFTNTTAPVVPPCQEVIKIQSACTPSGTSGIYLLALLTACAEDLSSQTYDILSCFQCSNCKFIHGARSPQIVDFFHKIITSASHALCTGTPTTSFAAIFESISNGATPTGTNSAVRDQVPSQTAISLYYTVSGTQGADTITGEAVSDTRTASVTPTSSTMSSTAAGTNEPAGTGAAAGTLSSSKAGAAMPTGARMGAIGEVAGAVGMVVS